MEIFRLDLPSDDDRPSASSEEVTEFAHAVAHMSLAFDELRAALAKLDDPDQATRIRREVTAFLRETTNDIND
ncbi:hypothetical protein [Nonomuraea sp. NPDC048901]|uniref:hypothetical protein n=1 Tax=Nonomuraea sp. NPDC048901 TaxID=3155627 RepID=UPI0033DE2B70